MNHHRNFKGFELLTGSTFVRCRHIRLAYEVQLPFIISLEISEMVEGIQEGKFPDDNNLKVRRVTDLFVRAMVECECRMSYSVHFI